MAPTRDQSTPSSVEAFRCRRADWCSEREPVHDPVTGDHTGYVGAPLDTADGLCERCQGKLLDALVHLPGDVAELTTLLARPMTVEFTELVTCPSPEPAIPLRVDVEALRALIDHETSSWARSVADDDRVQLNRAQVVYLNPIYPAGQWLRVAAACFVLRTHLPVLLEMGPTEHRARSLGVRRTDGHDEDTTTRYADDYWTTRDGLTGAILLINLHQRAWRWAARHTNPHREQMPCRGCGRLALRRWPGADHAKCSYCGHTVPEDHLDVLKTALANSQPARKAG